LLSCPIPIITTRRDLFQALIKRVRKEKREREKEKEISLHSQYIFGVHYKHMNSFPTVPGIKKLNFRVSFP
jgi:hypothetical protein